MDETNDEKYLGDVISSDGRNIKNIKARISKGTGIVSNIITKLEGIPFGKHLTAAELDLIETVDMSLLRQLLNAPRGTPKEMIYLELGCIPFREIIREKRLRFLYYILNSDPKSLVNRFFNTQMKNRTKKDWVTTVLEDLKVLDLGNLSMEEIKNMKKTSFTNMIKHKIQIYTFKSLEGLKNLTQN